MRTLASASIDTETQVNVSPLALGRRKARYLAPRFLTPPV
jgi:hypothetical protein